MIPHEVGGMEDRHSSMAHDINRAPTAVKNTPTIPGHNPKRFVTKQVNPPPSPAVNQRHDMIALALPDCFIGFLFRNILPSIRVSWEHVIRRPTLNAISNCQPVAGNPRSMEQAVEHLPRPPDEGLALKGFLLAGCLSYDESN